MNGDPFWQAMQAQGLSVNPVVEGFHAGLGTKTYIGFSSITRGRGPIPRLALWLAGFPPAGLRVPTQVTITTADDGCTWERDFGGHVTRSRLSFDPTTSQVVERFGPIRLALAIDADATALRITVVSMRLFGVPVPKMLLPVSDTTESEGEGGQFRFEVSARVPGIGPLIAYRGELRAEQAG